MLHDSDVCDVEVQWDGGSLFGGMENVFVYIKLLRGSSP